MNRQLTKLYPYIYALPSYCNKFYITKRKEKKNGQDKTKNNADFNQVHMFPR